MWESVGDEVTVPSVVGLPFERARTIAAAAGVTLANTDPDGPPIDALAWEGAFFVSAQRPVGGTVVTRHSSVVVEITEEGARERNNALFTAGLVMAGLGAVLASFPNGLILGLVIALAGGSLAVVFATRVWRGRYRRQRLAAGASPHPDRFRNAEEYLQRLVVVSATFTVATIGLAFLKPEDEEWARLWLFGPLLFASAIAFVLVRRHNRSNRAATGCPGPSAE